MVIFPKNINEKIWSEHLRMYGPTLSDYCQEISTILPTQYHDLHFSNIYICPLCAKNYYIYTSSGIEGNSEFSLDHVPPESLGGKFKILTCKKCNNDSGVFEAELLKVINIGLAKDNPDLFSFPKVKIKNDKTGDSILGSVHVNNNRADIRFSENAKKYNSKYIDFLSSIHSGNMPKLKLEIPSADLARVEKALLKSAYLICFIWWGYEFVFSKNGALIRKVINNQLNYPTTVPTLWKDTKQGELLKGISILRENLKRIAFMVNIELKGSKRNCTASILIPNPTESGWDSLKELDNIIKANSTNNFNYVTLPRIVDRIGYSISWYIVLPENDTKG
jgi:hypothetical protein